MKQFICILLSWVALLSCNNKDNQQSDKIYVTAIVDITDPRQVYPDAESILPLYNLNNEENSDVSFRICTVTDRELNPNIEFHLPVGDETEKSNTEDDPDHRKKLIVQFFSSIRNTITDFNTDVKSDTAFAHSECFKSISNELQNLVRNKSNKGILLVYSDLQEHSAIFNCYAEANQKLLASHPEKVIEIFQETPLLPESLDNITVCFIYNPVSREDDILFMAMLKVYKKLLQSRGAIVSVSANNHKYTKL